ncbi:MAG: carboxypeptidase regulatory-like domain-containing protein, partial [Ignisphaera sp.]
TDSAGYYELNVPSGIYTVYAYKPGYVQANVTGVIVAPEAVTWVNITLEKIPPTVVVLANVDYYTRPHLKDIVSSLGLPVVEYNNMTKLLEDWINGLINPAVVIIDHTMPSPYSYPPADIVLLFHLWADAVGSSLIWLGTSYSGYTGIDVLFLYNTTLVTFGYPAPNSRLIGYPSVAYVQVTMLNMTHPIFSNVTPDIPPNVFYLATGSYADYAIYNFTDPTGRFTILAYVNDTRPGYERYFGVGVAEWISNSGKPWYYLGSWAESYWMQYLEPGADGMYTDNTQRVLENAVLLGWSSVVGSTARSVNKQLLVQALIKSTPLIRAQSSTIKPLLYTPVTVYMPRQPHGYVIGRVVDPDGAPIAGALVEVLGTPVKTSTDLDGFFNTWLPVGTYILRVTKPGYKERSIEAVVEEGETTDLGDIVLPRTLRVATLHDYGDALKNFFNSKGWYSASYTNITQLTNDILTGLWDVVVYAGYYGVPFPTFAEFAAFLNATFEKRVSVIWMDSYGSYGYGIKVLNTHLNDPPSVGYTWGYPVYIVVTKPHPILRGYSVGQQVPIITYSSADFSWFTGFSGEAIADTLAGGVVRGNSIAWKVFENNVKWVLLSSFAPTGWNLPTYFTADAWNIIYNSVLWVGAKPLNLTLENPYLRVGDTLILYIADGPPLSEIVIAINGVEVGRAQTNENGEAEFTYVIPLTPGGRYLLEAYTEDYLYYGAIEFSVIPSLKVYPSVIRTPGVVYLEATGLASYQLVYVYVDDNWLSFRRASENGTLFIKLNIPLLEEGEHTISLVDFYTGEDIVSQDIYVTSQLDEIQDIVTNIRDKLITLEPVILSIDNNVAIVLTNIGVIQVTLDDIRSLIEEQNAVLAMITEDIAIIKTDVGEIKVKLEALEPLIIDIYDNTVVIITQLGEVKADLQVIMELIESSKETILTEMRDGFATLQLMITNATLTLMAKLDELEPVIMDIKDNTVTILTKLGEVKADLQVIISSLGSLDARITGINNTVVTIQTAIGQLQVRVDKILENLGLMNSTIVTITNDIAVIKTNIGVLMTNISNLLSVLRDVNATITGLVVDAKGSILAEINTSRGSILAELSAVKDLIRAGLPISTEELRITITALIQETGETLSERISSAEHSARQSGVTAGIATILILIALGLIAYQILLMRKPKK